VKGVGLKRVLSLFVRAILVSLVVSYLAGLIVSLATRENYQGFTAQDLVAGSISGFASIINWVGLSAQAGTFASLLLNGLILIIPIAGFVVIILAILGTIIFIALYFLNGLFEVLGDCADGGDCGDCQTE
jgi:hypothetical protein